MCCTFHFQVIERLCQSVTLNFIHFDGTHSLLYSLDYYPTRSLHFGRHDPDVQDPGSQLLNYGLQSERSVPRRHQVWRLSGHNYWYADVRVLPVHFASQGQRIFLR